MPNQEVPVNFLIKKVMTVIHLICVESEHCTGAVNLGLGFPQYNKEEKNLGSVIRLFAYSYDILRNATCDHRMQRLDDYIRKGEILEVPSDIREYVQYKRIQFKTNKERLMRRYAKRHNMDIGQVENLYVGYSSQKENLPYVMMDSLSSGLRFRLYIDEVKQLENSSPLIFNCYGLTVSGSLPYFNN